MIAAVEPRTKASAWPSSAPAAATAASTSAVMSTTSPSPAVENLSSALVTVTLSTVTASGVRNVEISDKSNTAATGRRPSGKMLRVADPGEQRLFAVRGAVQAGANDADSILERDR